MNRSQILDHWANDAELKRIISKLCGKDSYLKDEATQELFLVLCSLPDQKLMDLHNSEKLLFWIVATLENMLHSDRSTFYRKIKKFSKHSKEFTTQDAADEEDFTTLLRLESLDKHIAELNYFDKAMMGDYLELRSFRAVAKRLNLHEQLVSRIMKRIMSELREKIKSDIPQ